jgi:hypothetical protein
MLLIRSDSFTHLPLILSLSALTTTVFHRFLGLFLVPRQILYAWFPYHFSSEEAIKPIRVIGDIENRDIKLAVGMLNMRL